MFSIRSELFRVRFGCMWASLIAQLVKNLPAMQETPVWFLGQENPLEKGYTPHTSILGLPCGSSGKESAFNVGDLDSILVLGISPGEGKDYPLQYSGLENSMDCMYSIVHGISKDWTQLSHSPHSPLWLGWSEIKSLFMLSSISVQWPGNDWVLNKICCYKPQGHDPQLLNL